MISRITWSRTSNIKGIWGLKLNIYMQARNWNHCCTTCLGRVIIIVIPNDRMLNTKDRGKKLIQSFIMLYIKYTCPISIAVIQDENCNEMISFLSIWYKTCGFKYISVFWKIHLFISFFTSSSLQVDFYGFAEVVWNIWGHSVQDPLPPKKKNWISTNSTC